jgi:hypothetical protein
MTILFTLSLLFTIATNSLADFEPDRRDYAVGWQISSGTACGFSVKIPYKTDYYIQPVFSIAMSQKDDSTTGNYAFGLRGIYNLEKRQDFLPYMGVALGYSKNFEKVAASDSSNSRFGYQGFFGVEYQKYLLRPALEVGIGGINKSNGSYQAGVILNLSLMYYF